MNINRDGNISFLSAVEATMDSVCERACDQAKQIYTQGMEQITQVCAYSILKSSMVITVHLFKLLFTFSQELTGEDAPLVARHQEMLAAADRFYHEHTEGLFPGSVEKFFRILTHRIAEEFTLITARNLATRMEIARNLAVIFSLPFHSPYVCNFAILI